MEATSLRKFTVISKNNGKRFVRTKMKFVSASATDVKNYDAEIRISQSHDTSNTAFASTLKQNTLKLAFMLGELMA